MAQQWSSTARQRINEVDGRDLGVYILIIEHPDLTAPLRVVNDNADLVHLGDTYIALPFHVKPPDDISTGIPKGTIEIANPGREIMPWLDQSHGGDGAIVTIRYVFRQFPDSIEWELTGLALSNVQATSTTISASIGYEDILNIPAVAKRYTPSTQPGIF